MQNQVKSEIGDLEFFRPEDSGNFVRASRNRDRGENSYRVWMSRDNEGTRHQRDFRMWYFFGIFGGHKGLKIEIEIMNINPMLAVYNRNMVPVFLSTKGRDVPINGWKPIPDDIHIEYVGRDLHLRFSFTFPHEFSMVYFCPYAPFSYTQLQNSLNRIDDICSSTLKAKDIYYAREHLVDSLDGHRVDLLTISSVNQMANDDRREKWIPNIFPIRANRRPHLFPTKRYVFIGCRVHPGENQASYCMRGLLRFLTGNHYVARRLRDIYVFKVVPMLNPDGVYRGNYRCDSNGVNLNRMYGHPTLSLHPTIYAWKEVMNQASKRFLVVPKSVTPDVVDGSGPKATPIPTNTFLGSKTKQMCFYMDMHGHAMRPGCYTMTTAASGFGPSAHNEQALKFMFAKLLSQKSPHFNLDACSFGSKRCKKKNDAFASAGIATATASHALLERKKQDAAAIKDWKRIKEEAASLGKTTNDTNKSGTGRVVACTQFGLTHSYTLEASCNVSSASQILIGGMRKAYSPFEYESVGKGVCEALLDLNNTIANPGTIANGLAEANRSLSDKVYEWAKKQSLMTEREAKASSTKKYIKESETLFEFPMRKPFSNPERRLKVAKALSKKIRRSLQMPSSKRNTISAAYDEAYDKELLELSKLTKDRLIFPKMKVSLRRTRILKALRHKKRSKTVSTKKKSRGGGERRKKS